MLIDSPAAMRTDLHQHLWPPELIAALRARSSPPHLEGDAERPLLRMRHEPGGQVVLAGHALQRRLDALDAAGIDRTVISLSTPLGIEALPEAESVELIGAYHDGIERLVGESGGRLAAWAAPPLQADDGGAAVVSAAIDRGFVGASVPSEVLASPHALDAVEPLLAMLERRGRPLFVHPGPAPGTEPYALDHGMPGWWPNLGVYPGLSVRAFFAWRAVGAARHPGLRVCFAIMAGAAPFLEERWRVFSGETRAVDRNLFLDTASCGRLALECAMATYGVEQIVFGTDMPVISSDPVTRALTGLGPAAFEAVTERNPLRLLDTRDMETR
jgi:predicted TIM-barrel fold metal-dependent hydrolase